MVLCGSAASRIRWRDRIVIYTPTLDLSAFMPPVAILAVSVFAATKKAAQCAAFSVTYRSL
jgi:hypothetical protein